MVLVKFQQLNRILCGVFSLLMIFTLVACDGSPQKTTPQDDTNLSQQQKAEKARLEREKREQQNARGRRIYIGLKGIQVINQDSTEMSLRLAVNINNKLKPLLYTFQLKSGDTYDIQDKTRDVQALVTDQNLWVAAYKTVSDNKDYLALETRLLRENNHISENASQFVLFELNSNVRNGYTLISKEFEFQTRSDLQAWTQDRIAKNKEERTGEKVIQPN